MKVFVSGGTGFVGRMVIARLLGEGDEVVVWTRNTKRARGILGADVTVASPSDGFSLEAVLENCDAVVNLQGENIFSGRWTTTQKQKLVSSRVDFTRQLVDAIQNLGEKGPSVLVSGSAVGYYGIRVDNAAGEDSPPGDDFLARLCQDWEAAALSAKTSGCALLRYASALFSARLAGARENVAPI